MNISLANITKLLLVAFVLPSSADAWSNDERSYPSNDVDKNKLAATSSLFQLQLYHPWTDGDPFLTDKTVDTIRDVTEDVLQEVLSDHFDEAYLSLPTTNAEKELISQFRTIEVDVIGRDELGFDEIRSDDFEELPKCPCSTISLSGTAHFTLSRAISTSHGIRKVQEIDGERFRTYFDDLIQSLLQPTRPGGIALESKLQTSIAFFAEGQGFAARIIEPIDQNTAEEGPLSRSPSVFPNPAPTQAPSRQNAQNAPPLRISPAPTPLSINANGAISSAAQPTQSADRTIFLVGSILGACFFVAAFLLLRRTESHRLAVKQHTTKDSDDSIEEIEFYTNHLRPTPSRYVSNYSPKDNAPPLRPGCMAMELSSDYSLSGPARHADRDTTPKASNKASKESSWPQYDILSPPSQAYDAHIPQRDIFEVKSLDDLDPLQTPSVAVKAQVSPHCQSDLQSSSTSTSFSDNNGVWPSFDGWSTCSSWQSVASAMFSRPDIAAKTSLASDQDRNGNSPAISPSSPSPVLPAEANQATEKRMPNRSLEERPGQNDPPTIPQANPPTDDGSFHGSVESFDSLISSCWDPNDNSTGDIISVGTGAPTVEASSTASALADDVSFYPHVRFMSNPKMMRWAERAKRSLASVEKETSGSSVESLVTKAADQMTATKRPSDVHPYLSVSFSNSTESSFDEHGFKVVNNCSQVV